MKTVTVMQSNLRNNIKHYCELAENGRVIIERKGKKPLLLTVMDETSTQGENNLLSYAGAFARASPIDFDAERKVRIEERI